MTDYRADFEFHRNTLEFDSSLNKNRMSLNCKVTGREDKHYTYNQAIASDTWTINHNLNKKPSITIVDSADTMIIGFKAEYVDLNTVIISFNGGFTGKAYLN